LDREGFMISIRPIAVDTLEEAGLELEKIGFSPPQAENLAPETVWLRLKVEGIHDSLIGSLKGMVQPIGTRLIIPPGSDDGSRNRDLLLSGTLLEMEKLAATLENKSPGLHDISIELRRLTKNMAKTQFTIPCRTRTLRLGERTLIMGALNVTPDSFSDGGLFFQRDRAVARALEMVDEGADILDIGGESTRPGSRATGPDEELRRVIPVIEKVAKVTDTPISVDTRRARVAREALEAGGQIINDTSALRFDSAMGEVLASCEVPVVLMHIRGTPETMQQEIHYVSLLSEIIQYLKQGIDHASAVGVDSEKIIIDPGIGFGKTVEHNLAIIKHLYQLRILGRPILIGTSRKSFIGKILNLDVDQREEGTIASVAASILNGAHIVRVHNVRNAVRAARITDAIKGVCLPEA
jgi:dihydropteroate synthase